MFHRQCRMKKYDTYQTSWIPEKYAKVGKVLSLKHEDGWEVVKVGNRMDSKEVQRRSMDYRNQRKASDI